MCHILKKNNISVENIDALTQYFVGETLTMALIMISLILPYFLAANLGMLVLNVLWSIVGVYGDLSNPLSCFYALPALLFAVGASIFLSKRKKNKK